MDPMIVLLATVLNSGLVWIGNEVTKRDLNCPYFLWST
jgi:hypothetical protein